MRFFILSLLLACSIAGYTQRQEFDTVQLDTFFYQGEDGGHLLIIDRSRVFIYLAESMSVIAKKEFLRAYDYLEDGPVDSEINAPNAIVAGFRDPTSMTTMYTHMQHLLQNPRVKHVSPSFVGVQKGYLNQFTMKLERNQYKEMERLGEKLNVRFYRYGSWPDVYQVVTSKESEAGPFEIARYLQRMGVIEWFEPEFVLHDSQLEMLLGD